MLMCRASQQKPFPAVILSEDGPFRRPSDSFGQDDIEN